MDDDFAARLNTLYREIYHHGARRIADARERPSSETLALLLHLAQSGPLTLSEMAAHLSRALSTVSAKVALLEAQGLLARQPDEQDGRRALIWLSPQGRATLDDSLQVLDARRVAGAAARLSAEQRGRILQALAELHQALAAADPVSQHPQPDEEPR